mmetsp:Transcript_25541/g.41518  ORF Transcript_25541/g.41518 Transcript_25541/m.41518 type:complete len:765 (-) Transcript_25541:1453-3747(-)
MAQGKINTNNRRLKMAPATAPLKPVLRLIHCLQKERGASCGLLGFRGVADTDANNSLKTHSLRVASCRCNTNSAISSFYASGSWYNHCVEADDKFEVAQLLYDIRQLIDGAGEANEDLAHYHLVLIGFNTFVASVIQTFVVTTVRKRREIVKHALKTLIKSPEEAQLRKNYEIALSLMSLILSFVNLKESLGMERATLTGLMAFGAEVAANDRLPVIVNDLVMVVENHNRIMRELEKETGVKMESWSESRTITTSELAYDENYCSLLRLIAESIKPCDSMSALQDHIRKDFDVNAFQQEMSMEAFWSGITLYMDRLHSTELILLEELPPDDKYGKTYKDLDLLSLGTTAQQGGSESSLHAALKKVTLEKNNLSKRGAAAVVNKLSSEELTQSMIAFLTQGSPNAPERSPKVNAKDHVVNKTSSKVSMDDQPSLEDWEISLYDVEFQKRIGRGAAGTTYLGKFCGQQVAIKVAATNDMGLEGWSNELKSLTKLHHCNIIHFLGAIYNPSPLTYCLVLEYCNGGDLDAYLHGNGGSITPPNFFETVAKGVASGLLYLHKKNIMHRDIKPGNVLLSGDLQGNFTAKLTDFGLSAMLQHNASVNSGGDLTAETGTYRYMAPEVIKHQKYHMSADIYSLSVLMWEIITREVPFKNMSQIEAAGSVAIEGKRPPFPEGIPSYIKFMIEKCWTESPKDRMSTEEVIKTLEELENNLSQESRSWLDAPNGHPVYDVADEGKIAHQSQAVELKKKPKKMTLKKMTTFRRASKV